MTASLAQASLGVGQGQSAVRGRIAYCDTGAVKRASAARGGTAPSPHLETSNGILEKNVVFSAHADLGLSD
jgi:hypothetical protein